MRVYFSIIEICETITRSLSLKLHVYFGKQPSKMPVCCIMKCGARKKENQPQLSLHRFPKNEGLRKKWLEAIGEENINPGHKEWYVCSLHFEESCFNRTLDVMRLQDNSVPTIFSLLPLHQDKLKMAPIDQTEIKFCRVCLAVDVKMYDMREFRLSEMFQNITRIPACDETERVLHHVCWECAARLTTASAFRDKALLTDTLLKDVVHRKRDIEQLKQHYSHLKSPLTVQTVFTSADIECGDTPIELHRDETGKRKVYKGRTKRKGNEEEEETVFDEEEPLIEFPVKTEIESDPFAENEINNQIKDRNSVTFSQITHLDDSFTPSKDDNDYEIRNNEKHINEKSEDIEMMDAPITYGINLVEDNVEKQPTIDTIDKYFDEPASKDTEETIETNDDRDIVSDDDSVEENPVLDGIGNISDSSSSEEDGQSLAELVSVKKVKKQTSRKVGASSKSKRSNIDSVTRAEIIVLYEQGKNLSEIARETGVNRKTVVLWVRRFKEGGSLQHRQRTGRPRIINASQRQTMLREHKERGFLQTNHYAGLFNTSAVTVRRALHSEGLHYRKHIVKPLITKKP